MPRLLFIGGCGAEATPLAGRLGGAGGGFTITDRILSGGGGGRDRESRTGGGGGGLATRGAAGGGPRGGGGGRTMVVVALAMFIDCKTVSPTGDAFDELDFTSADRNRLSLLGDKPKPANGAVIY